MFNDTTRTRTRGTIDDISGERAAILAGVGLTETEVLARTGRWTGSAEELRAARHLDALTWRSRGF